MEESPGENYRLRESCTEEGRVKKIKKEIKQEFFQNNAVYVTWYIEIGSNISKPCIDYAKKKGLFCVIEQYDAHVEADKEILVVLRFDPSSREGINCLEDIRRSMRTPIQKVGFGIPWWL